MLQVDQNIPLSGVCCFCLLFSSHINPRLHYLGRIGVQVHIASMEEKSF